MTTNPTIPAGHQSSPGTQDPDRGIAAELARVFGDICGMPLPVRLRAWDDSFAGPADGPEVVLRSPAALRRLVWHPNELGLAQAYVTGELDVPGAWSDPAVTQALGYIVDLVHAGAFGTNYGSVGQDSGGADALLSSGKAAMELMGSWEYGGQLSTSPAFVKSGNLAWADFPTVPNGQGDPRTCTGSTAGTTC